MLEILLSGPLAHRSSAIAALQRAGIDKGQFVDAHHGFHPDHVDASDGWLAYQSEELAAHDAAADYGWRLRLHRHALPVAPKPADPWERIVALEARLAAIEHGRSPLPPIAGGALESPPYVIAAAEHQAYLFRQMPQSLMSGTGVVGSGDLLVTPNSPTAMNVLVAAGQVWIPGTIAGSNGFGANGGAQSSVSNTNGGSSTSTGYPTSFTAQANYYAYNDGQVTMALASADPTNPRIDLICGSVQDAEYAGTQNQCLLQVVTGTAAATPEPPVPPANSVITSSIWVPNGVTSITSGDINDLRPLANSPAWQALTLSTSPLVVAGPGYTPGARLEGRRVFLRGGPNPSGGNIASGTVVMTVPAGMRPSVTLFTPICFYSNTGVPGNFSINASGQMTTQESWGNGSAAALDGISYTLV